MLVSSGERRARRKRPPLAFSGGRVPEAASHGGRGRLTEAAKELVEGQKLLTPRRKAAEPAKNAKDFRGATLCAFASRGEAWHFFAASLQRGERAGGAIHVLSCGGLVGPEARAIHESPLRKGGDRFLCQGRHRPQLRRPLYIGLAKAKMSFRMSELQLFVADQS